MYLTTGDSGSFSWEKPREQIQRKDQCSVNRALHKRPRNQNTFSAGPGSGRCHCYVPDLGHPASFASAALPPLHLSPWGAGCLKASRQPGLKMQLNLGGRGGGGGWPRPSNSTICPRLALVYSSHVPRLPSCHCYNYTGMVAGSVWMEGPLVSLELYYCGYSLSGHKLPSVGLLKMTVILIYHGASQLLQGQLSGKGLCSSPHWP